MIDFKGSQIGWKELSERFSIPVSTLFNRYQSGLRNDDLVSSHHQGALNKRAASKLTEYEVIAIKRKLEAGKLTQAAIAKQFNVHQCHISDIKRGKRWAEIEI